MDQHISTPPPPGDPRAYDEGKIVQLFTEIAKILLALSFIDAQDVIWPSAETGEHAISDEVSALMAHLRLSDRVVSLIKHLPYIGGGSEIWPTSRMFKLIMPYPLRRSRDPHMLVDAVPELSVEGPDFYLRPGDVALTTSASYGWAMILDTETNTIRWEHDIEDFRPTSTHQRGQLRRQGWPPLQGWEPEYPDCPRHYRNAAAIHAPLVLQDMIDRWRRLSFLLTDRICWQMSTAMTGEHVWDKQGRIRRTLMEEYGWPDDFREGDWRRDQDGVLERMWKEFEEWEQEHKDSEEDMSKVEKLYYAPDL